MSLLFEGQWNLNFINYVKVKQDFGAAMAFKEQWNLIIMSYVKWMQENGSK